MKKPFPSIIIIKQSLNILFRYPLYSSRFPKHTLATIAPQQLKMSSSNFTPTNVTTKPKAVKDQFKSDRGMCLEFHDADTSPKRYKEM